MGFTCGIVGLPNVGKSTLFNALSSGHAEAQNYPFCTIAPNVASVVVPDPRLDILFEAVRPPKAVPSTLELYDIAGLVRGASKGEGLGNQFLSHIREVDAIVHVVRCFEGSNVVHVDGRVDPVADVETVQTELCLKDLETVQKRRERALVALKAHRPEDKIIAEVCDLLVSHLDQLRPARTLFASGNERSAAGDERPSPGSERSTPADERLSSAEARALLGELFLLTMKPVVYVANVAEETLARPEANPHFVALRDYARREGAMVVPVCASFEAQVAELEPADRREFLASAGLEEPSLVHVIRAGYTTLGLVTFFTIGDAEVRAWTVRRGTRAPAAAGRIHTDFERGFIRAEVVHWSDFAEHRSVARCREIGRLLIEGKEYAIEDGDVVHFRFNV